MYLVRKLQCAVGVDIKLALLLRHEVDPGKLVPSLGTLDRTSCGRATSLFLITQFDLECNYLIKKEYYYGTYAEVGAESISPSFLLSTTIR